MTKQKNDIRKLYFYLCSFLSPLFIYLLFILNTLFGVVCADGCAIHSYVSHYFILCFLIGIVVLNIMLFVLTKKQLNRPALWLWLVILNCILSLYAFSMSINLWAFGIIVFPAMITIPIQFVLLWYIFLKEVLHTKKHPFLFSSILGIVTCILAFLLFKIL